MMIKGPAPASMVFPDLDASREAFIRDGYVVLRGWAAADRLARLRLAVQAELEAAAAPVEYEADLAYPGAPKRREDEGGHTVRRLLDAYGRGPAFQDWATDPGIGQWLTRYFGAPPSMSRVHHNCIMTKHPRYGSLTGWHRDIRYWSFNRPELVSSWLALGPESACNGGLWFIPGSHTAQFEAGQFDAQTFFRTDLPANQAFLDRAVCPTLAPGDVVLFDCRTLHCAGRNDSAEVKFSIVYTYHGPDCLPLPGTRSASQPEVALAGATG